LAKFEGVLGLLFSHFLTNGNNKTKLKRFYVERKRVVEDKRRMVAQTNAKAFAIQKSNCVFIINFYFISIF